MDKNNNCVKIGQKAPCFDANSTFGPVSLSDYKGKWLVFFSHPGDFTPVCTTEFMALSKEYARFAAKNACLLGLSIDSNPSHLAWVKDIYDRTGIEIAFPIIADRSGKIAKAYGMLSDDPDKFATVRNTYIICPEGIIRAILIYPYTNGRFIPEILRLLDALQQSYEYGVVTPANWTPGSPAMLPPPQTWDEVKKREDNGYNKNRCESWYMCYTK